MQRWRRGLTKKTCRKHLFYIVSELCAYLSFLDLADGGSREQYISFTCLFTSEVEQLTQVGDESGFLCGYRNRGERLEDRGEQLLV
jgi:hypothetical protein